MITYGSIDGRMKKCHAERPEILFHEDGATETTENLKWKYETSHQYPVFCYDRARIRSARQKCRPINALYKFENLIHRWRIITVTANKRDFYNGDLRSMLSIMSHDRHGP